MGDGSFSELAVFQETYRASLAVMTWVVPFLPPVEQRDLADRLRRTASTIPSLIARAGDSQVKSQSRTILREASGHCREAVVMLFHCRDLYARYINGKLCQDLISLYQRSSDDLLRVAGKVKVAEERT